MSELHLSCPSLNNNVILEASEELMIRTAFHDVYAELFPTETHHKAIIEGLIELNLKGLIAVLHHSLDVTDPHIPSYVDVLDQIASRINPSHSLFRKILKTLIKFCTHAGRLPASCLIPPNYLVKRGPYPEFYGGCANVWRGKYKDDDVALKELQLCEGDDVREMLTIFYREALVWKYLRHPNVLPFLGINETLFKFCMISPWEANGNINRYLKENPTENRTNLLRGAASGLEYLHSLGIVHGDLKSANILVNEKGDACLADFGLSTLIRNFNTVTANAIPRTSSVGPQGSIRWMAPEIMDPEKAGLQTSESTKESDVYSFSMVMMEIYSGRYPFDDRPHDVSVMAAVIAGVRPRRPPEAEASAVGLTDAIWKLIEKSWNGDPRKRPTVSEIVKGLQPSSLNIGNLPYNVILRLVRFLPVEDIIHILSSCRALHLLMHEDAIWKEVASRYGVFDTTHFSGRSFYSVYTGLLHTYAPLLGIWAGDNPFTGSIIEFRLDCGSDARPAGIIGEVWCLGVASGTEAEESEEADDPQQKTPTFPPLFDSLYFVPAIFITFSDRLQPGNRTAIPALREPRAQVFCCWGWDGSSSQFVIGHQGDLRVVSETTQDIVLHTDHGSFKHPEFPSCKTASCWRNTTHRFPRLRSTIQPLIKESPKSHVHHHSTKLPQLIGSSGGSIKPKALLLTCPDKCMLSSLSELEYSQPYQHPTRYYPLEVKISLGIAPNSDDWRPQSLVGLWLGDYSGAGVECIFVDWDESRNALYGLKITGDEYVPRGVVSWTINTKRPYAFAPSDPRIRNSGLDSNEHRLFRGTIVSSDPLYFSDEQDTPPVILGVVGPDDMRMIWTESGGVYAFTRYRGRAAMAHQAHREGRLIGVWQSPSRGHSGCRYQL